VTNEKTIAKKAGNFHIKRSSSPKQRLKEIRRIMKEIKDFSGLFKSGRSLMAFSKGRGLYRGTLYKLSGFKAWKGDP
jgi:hypothetical protein